MLFTVADHILECRLKPQEALRADLPTDAYTLPTSTIETATESHRKPQRPSAQLANHANTGTSIPQSNGDTTRTSPLPFLQDHVMHGVPHPSQALCEIVPHPFKRHHAIVPHPFQDALETVPHHFLMMSHIVPHHKKEDRHLSPSPVFQSSTSGKSEST